MDHSIQKTPEVRPPFVFEVLQSKFKLSFKAIFFAIVNFESFLYLYYTRKNFTKKCKSFPKKCWLLKNSLYLCLPKGYNNRKKQFKLDQIMKMYKVYPVEYVGGFCVTYCNTMERAQREKYHLMDITGVIWKIKEVEL